MGTVTSTPPTASRGWDFTASSAHLTFLVCSTWFRYPCQPACKSPNAPWHALATHTGNGAPGPSSLAGGERLRFGRTPRERTSNSQVFVTGHDCDRLWRAKERWGLPSSIPCHSSTRGSLAALCPLTGRLSCPVGPVSGNFPGKRFRCQSGRKRTISGLLTASEVAVDASPKASFRLNGAVGRHPARFAVTVSSVVADLRDERDRRGNEAACHRLPPCSPSSGALPLPMLAGKPFAIPRHPHLRSASCARAHPRIRVTSQASRSPQAHVSRGTVKKEARIWSWKQFRVAHSCASCAPGLAVSGHRPPKQLNTNPKGTGPYQHSAVLHSPGVPAVPPTLAREPVKHPSCSGDGRWLSPPSTDARHVPAASPDCTGQVSAHACNFPMGSLPVARHMLLALTPRLLHLAATSQL